MPIQKQDLLNLCALAVQNEDLIVGIGKMALALSPNAQAFNIARGVAGMVFNRLGVNNQSGYDRSPSGNSRYGKQIPAGEYIQNLMNEDQQEELIDRVSGVLGNRSENFSFNDLLGMVLNNSNVKNLVIREIKRFLESENLSCNRSYDCCSRSRSCSRY